MSGVDRIVRKIWTLMNEVRLVQSEFELVGVDLSPAHKQDLLFWIRGLKERVARLEERLRMSTPKGESRELGEGDGERLFRLDRHLDKVWEEVGRMSVLAHEIALQCVQDDRSAISDFELESRFDFELAEDDPQADPEEDNIIATCREDGLMLNSARVRREPGHFAGDGDEVCWLFHELTDHQHLREADLLRIGCVQIEIVPRWQACFDLRSGRWSTPDRDVVANKKQERLQHDAQ